MHGTPAKERRPPPMGRLPARGPNIEPQRTCGREKSQTDQGPADWKSGDRHHAGAVEAPRQRPPGPEPMTRGPGQKAS